MGGKDWVLGLDTEGTSALQGKSIPHEIPQLGAAICGPQGPPDFLPERFGKFHFRAWVGGGGWFLGLVAEGGCICFGVDASFFQDVEQFVGGDNGDTVRKRSSENYGFPKLQPRTMLRNVFLKDENLFWRFLERGFVEWRSYNGAAGGEGAGATIDKNEGYLTVSPMMHYAMTKKVHCSNGDFKAAVSRQEHMHDRLIMRNSTHDSRALESEREELERSENVHLEAWLFAKRSYCDGKLTKRQFEMVELELRLKDHHFEVLLDELNLREKTLLRTMDSVRRKLLQAKRRRHGD